MTFCQQSAVVQASLWPVFQLTVPGLVPLGGIVVDVYRAVKVRSYGGTVVEVT